MNSDMMFDGGLGEKDDEYIETVKKMLNADNQSYIKPNDIIILTGFVWQQFGNKKSDSLKCLDNLKRVYKSNIYRALYLFLYSFGLSPLLLVNMREK